MKRSLVLLVTAVLSLGCYHDNASPFVHGGGNKPPAWGSTWASASGSRSKDTGAGSYSASSGYAGGYEKEGTTAPALTAGTAPNTMAAPSMPAATTATAATHAPPAKAQTKSH